MPHLTALARRLRRFAPHHAAPAALLAVLACGAPSAPITSTLSPGSNDTGPRARGAFAVVFAGPRGDVADLAEPAVTVLFNRAMREAEALDTVGLPAMRLESEGAKPVGTWRWVGTHGLLFTPEHPLPGSARFKVTVPAGTRSVDGEALTTDYSFEFATSRPKVVEVAPAEEAVDVRPETVFRVKFNQPMTPSVAEQSIHLRVTTAGGAPRTLALTATHPTTGIARDETLLLKPVDKLPTDSAIDLVLDASLHGEGPLTAKAARTLHFRTYGPLRLADVKCPRATGPRCEAHRDFTVVLSNAVETADFKAHLRAPGLKILPLPNAAHAVRKKPPALASQLVSADPDFGKRYHLTLTAGLRDVFGQRLDHDVSFDVDTEAAWVADGKPVSSAQPAGPSRPPSEDEHERGAPPAPVADQAVPHRERLDYELQLGVKGHIVEALAKTGMKAHRMPIGSVNIPMFGTFTQKLAEEEALAWMTQSSTRAPDGQPWRWTWVLSGTPENVWRVQNVDVDALLGGGPSARGAALFALGEPGAATPTIVRMLNVTDLGVSAEVSRFGSLVWVTHLSSGLPVAGATVAVREVDKPDLFTATTDSEGLAVVPPGEWMDGKRKSARPQQPFFFVRSGNDWTYQPVVRAAADYNYGSQVDIDVEAKGGWAGMIYADRGVYRPGETMKLAGVFRKVDAAGVKIVPDQDARVLVEDSQGEKVFDGRTKLGPFGELAVDVALTKTSHLGSATIKVELGRKDEDSFSRDVLLAAYKASEFKVSVEPERFDYVRGDTADFAIHAEYLYGAPMGGAHYRTSVVRSASAFVPAASDGFVTTDDLYALDRRETSPAAEELKDTEGDLDDEGRAKTPLPLRLAHMRGPEEVVFEAQVEDLSHESIARRAPVRVHPAAFYLGVGTLPSRFVAVGADVAVKLVAFTPKGAHVADVAAKVELVERTWTNAAIDEAAEVPRRVSRMHDEVVASCDAKTTAALATCSVHVAKPGYYILRATAKDDRGNGTGASTSLYCLPDVSDEHVVAAWAPPGPSRNLKLEVDKKLYQAGDVAKILVQSPFKEAEALVTVERGGVLDRQVVALKGPMPVVSIQVKPEYFPNVFIGVRLVRGRVQDAPEQGADLGAPDFRLGVVPILVDPKTHRLKATVTTSRKEYRPGEEVDADVFVTDDSGKPGKGEVTFYAVDEGVLMLTSYETPDPLPAFSESRKLAVFSVENREDLAHLLPMKNGQRIKALGYDYLRASGGEDKGNDGGGGGDNGPRMDFKTTAFFEAGKVTDAEGHARYHWKLPDNLTTFRLMAVVAGADDRFGSGETTLVTSRHLMARPAMPRIVRVGDKFEAGVLVSSKDIPAVTAHVTLAVKGVTLVGAGARDVMVPHSGSVEVRFPVVAMEPGEASFNFAAVSGVEKDSVVVTRKLELPVSIETVSVYGETTEAVAVKLGALTHVRPDQGGLDVHLASTALVGLGSSFDRLVDYPYGCTEQLTSRILPLLVLPDLASAVGARLPANIDDAVDEGIGHLLEHQGESGGFSFWGDGDAAVPWLSAYAMLAVEGAAHKGMFVPKDARDRGVSYLRRMVNESVAEGDEEVTTDKVEGDEAEDAKPDLDPKEKRMRAYAELAFVADALATVGQSDAGTLSRLFEARAHRPLFSQALLLHAMAVAHLPVSQLETLSNEIVPRLRVDANTAYADEVSDLFGDFLDSSTRTSAMVLRALVAAKPSHPLASRLARGLLDHREGGAWRSTQENVWALLALSDYRKAQEATPPELDARVFLGGTLLGEGHFHGASSVDQPLHADMKRVFPEAGGPLTFATSGNGKLFYSAELRTAKTDLPQRGSDHGLYVQKLLRALKPDEIAAAQKVLPTKGVSRAAPGELVLVDLLFETAEPHDQVVIDDPLPAGLEPIDFALDTSAHETHVADDGPHGDEKGKALFQYGVAFRTAAAVHREQHDDKVLTFLGHVDPGIYHFRYVARATTPGDFVVPPTRAACMYSPEVSGASAATHFVVGAAPPARPVAKNP